MNRNLFKFIPIGTYDVSQEYIYTSNPNWVVILFRFQHGLMFQNVVKLQLISTLQTMQQSGSSYSQSSSSEEDQNAVLLTNKVQQKLLSVVARLKNKDPTLINIKKPIFQDDDFQEDNDRVQIKKQKNKLTYNKMMKDRKVKKGKEQYQQEQSSIQQQQQQLAPAAEQKKAKQMFKMKIKDIGGQDLFKLKKQKVKTEQKTEQQKFNTLINGFKTQDNLIKQFWGDNKNLDNTDLFLKRYILDKKWLSSKLNPNNIQQEVDDEDERRSQEMDQYEAQYNFRFLEPDGKKIMQFPRQIQQSLRAKSETRKEKRKAIEAKKKQQANILREEAQKKKEKVKANILSRIPQNKPEEGFEHDWFFCDDCGKGLQQHEQYYACEQCEDYILCLDCYQLIIHPHDMAKQKVPNGLGAPNPQIAEQIVKDLKSCMKCKKKIQKNVDRYEYTDRNYLITFLCEKCYDESNLQIKKKYKHKEGEKEMDIEKALDEDPQTIKKMFNDNDVDQMVDQYISNTFQGVLSGGLKTKFKYISVKPESYGLTDEQLLFGDDKQLNNYVSIKKLAPYREGTLKLRNNVYTNKIKTIQKSVKVNKRNLTSPNRLRTMKMRAAFLRKKRVKENGSSKLRLLNISNPQTEKRRFIKQARLQSYGLTN